LRSLGSLALEEGDYPAARAWLSQALTTYPEFDRHGFMHGLAVSAALAAAEGQPAAALRLAGAATALSRRTGILIQHSDRGRYERWVATAREALETDAAADAWAEGQQMGLDRAIAYALALFGPVPKAGYTSDEPLSLRIPDQLTARQMEVAGLIAMGLTNHQIADRLVVTDRAVAAHVERILDKLGFGSRAQIAVWASEHGLLATHSE
jgi:DNA-binding CsgD family transcriptional regulator